MATTISQTHIDLPGAEGHRFRLFERKHRPVEGGAGVVALERQAMGPFWTHIDSRVHPSFTKLSPQDQTAWARQMESELLEHWFSLEIARARD